MKKETNYDYTAKERMKNRDQKIKDAGLSNLKVVMLKEDAEDVREYAKKLYEKKGYKLEH